MTRLAVLVWILASLAATGGLVSRAYADDGATASELESQLVCPTCRTTLDQSDSPAARRIKAYIRERLVAGASAAQIKRELVAQFGPGVLSTPRTHGFDLLAWALPIGGVALAAVALGGLAWGWSRHGREAPAQDVTPLDPDLERRVDDELARFED